MVLNQGPLVHHEYSQMSCENLDPFGQNQSCLGLPLPCQHIVHWVQRKKVKSLSRVQLFVTPRTVAHQAPPSMGFSRQHYWSGVPFPSPGDPPNPGIEPVFLAPSTLAGGFLNTELHGKQHFPVDPRVNTALIQIWDLRNVSFNTESGTYWNHEKY